MEELYQQTVDHLTNRQRTYQLVFKEKDIAVENVLEDLKRFCKAGLETTFHENDRIHACYEGRRDVYNYILKHIELNNDEFIERFIKKER